jgi:hypothetical protein
MAGVLSHPDVEPVHGADRDLHHHLACRGRGIRALHELEDLGAAVLGDDDCPHQ